MEMLNTKKLLLAMLVTATTAGLAACSGDDGSDGADGADGAAGADGAQGTDGADGRESIGTPSDGLVRLATVPAGAEVTGAFITEAGDLFFNAQHPSESNVETDGNNDPYDTGTVGVIEGINFNSLPEFLVSSPVPSSDFERQTVQTAYGNYKILGQTGDTLGGMLPEGLGNIYDLAGDDLILANDMPDFNGYVSTGANTGYLFTNWEEYPGGMSRVGLEKASDGTWSVTSAEMIDFAGVNGTAALCFGSVTPWGTPLTSEEWIVNSSVDSTTDADWNDPAEIASNARLGRMWEIVEDGVGLNPYDYGYIIEITDPETTPVPVKHFGIGRYEHENAVVMPDQRTVYSSQDDTGGVLFKFVADAAGDLSSGTLYGAALTQDAGLNDPAVTGFDVDFVELASSDNATIEAWIREFDGILPTDFVTGQTNYMTVADVVAWADWVRAGRPAGTNYPTVANGGGPVTAGQPMDDRAAFLESRQAARQLGATAEWRKLEGISINHNRVLEAVTGANVVAGEVVTEAYLYMGIADIDNTMTDGEGDIQLSSRVKDCGGVFRAVIDSSPGNEYDLTRIEPVVMGSTYRSSLDGAARCDVNNLSQPDNTIVLEDGRIIIGEDGFQENNTLWLYDPR